jgi:hypothetical protein
MKTKSLTAALLCAFALEAQTPPPPGSGESPSFQTHPTQEFFSVQAQANGLTSDPCLASNAVREVNLAWTAPASYIPTNYVVRRSFDLTNWTVMAETTNLCCRLFLPISYTYIAPGLRTNCPATNGPPPIPNAP